MAEYVDTEGMIVSVGGSPEPVRVSLREARPGAVLFVASEGSVGTIQPDILSALDYRPADSYCVLPDANQLDAAYLQLRGEIAQWLRMTRIAPERVRVDFTGGTKPMSAALALAAMEHFSSFRYVSGQRRTKDGLGTVESGTEYLVHAANPWDVEAWKEREKAKWLYAGGQPASAAEVLRKAGKKCSEPMKKLLTAYAVLLEILDQTDRFVFGAALNAARKFREAHGLLLAREEGVEDLQAIERLWTHWEQLARETQTAEKEHAGGSEATLREMICNADRRAKQGRWDDAVARLYRATELWAQDQGYRALGAVFGRLPVNRLAAAEQERFVAMFGAPDEKGVKLLGLEALVRAIDAFGRREGEPERYPIYESLKDHLAKRNGSILAHGIRPATAEDYQQFRTALCTGLGLAENDLPHWPVLRFGVPNPAE